MAAARGGDTSSSRSLRCWLRCPHHSYSKVDTRTPPHEEHKDHPSGGCGHSLLVDGGRGRACFRGKAAGVAREHSAATGGVGAAEEEQFSSFGSRCSRAAQD